MNVSDYIPLITWAVIIGGVFGFAWHKGWLARLGVYVGETREELKKCTWPSRDELKGSTVVVMISIALLGVFTVVIDAVIARLVAWIM